MLKEIFLLKTFEEFCLFIFKIKKKFLLEKKTQIEINSIQNQIIEFIENQKQIISIKYGALGLQIFESIIFYMVVFADEVFINLQYEKQNLWMENLLEKKIFNSSTSGDVVFQHIDMFLNNSTSTDNEIGWILYSMLAFGFQGKYSDVEYLKQLKQKIYNNIYKKDLNMFEKSSFLFSQNYFSLISKNQSFYYYSYKIWLAYLAGIFCIYFFISHTFWHVNLYSINELLNQIKRL